jgi:hypothetical protein
MTHNAAAVLFLEKFFDFFLGRSGAQFRRCFSSAAGGGAGPERMARPTTDATSPIAHDAAARLFFEEFFEFFLAGFSAGFSEIFGKAIRTEFITKILAAAGKGASEESAAPPASIDLNGCRP